MQGSNQLTGFIAAEQAITQNHNPCKRREDVSTQWEDISFPLGQRCHQRRFPAEDDARVYTKGMWGLTSWQRRKKHESTQWFCFESSKLFNLASDSGLLGEMAGNGAGEAGRFGLARAGLSPDMHRTQVLRKHMVYS